MLVTSLFIFPPAQIFNLQSPLYFTLISTVMVSMTFMALGWCTGVACTTMA